MSHNSLILSRITAPNPEYATCADTYVKLVVYPGSHGVSAVSNLLKIMPTISEEKGKRITNSRGRTRVVENSLWILSSEGHVLSKDLRDHLDWLIDKLKENQNGLKKLQDLDGLKMTVACIWWSVFGHSGPVLWPEQMQSLADLNLECSFDIYFSGEN